MIASIKPGKIVLFGSGETSSSGRKIFDHVMRSLPPSPEVALLETPAGFELNSTQVIGRVGDFLLKRLQNFNPQIHIVPARKRGTSFSPDDPQLAQPLLSADMIFMGPGSPTYTVRQLTDSVAWHYLLARHNLGATITLASAATVAISAYTIPVYEIYKVGEDLHWIKGLDFFSRYGLPLVFVPHWNNTDGGQELDTSHCFMGEPRFLELEKMLPDEVIILGLDEKTGLVIDPLSGNCDVIGLGNATLIYRSEDVHSNDQSMAIDSAQFPNKYIRQIEHGQSFSLTSFTSFHQLKAGDGVPGDIWQLAIKVHDAIEAGKAPKKEELSLPDSLLELGRQRQLARQNKEWQLADRLREQMQVIGWMVKDTPDGQVFEAVAKQKSK